MPVNVPFLPAGRVVVSGLPEGVVARGVHQGAYEGRGESWGAFRSSTNRWWKTALPAQEIVAQHQRGSLLVAESAHHV